MANQQLIEYIRQQLLRGMAPTDLKTALMAAGWTESDIDEGLSKSDGLQRNCNLRSRRKEICSQEQR